jgi:hypothetical protein
LPFVTLAAGVGAIVTSERRRRTGAYIAIGVAVVMVLIAISVAIGRAYYLARVGAQYRTIAAAPFDALVGPLRAWTRAAFVVALGALVALWFTGSAQLVAREEAARARLTGLLRRYVRVGAMAGALLAAFVLVAWDKPRPFVVYSTVTLLALWELLCFAVAFPWRSGPPVGGTGGPAPPD